MGFKISVGTLSNHFQGLLCDRDSGRRPTKNLGDRGARCIYIPQQSWPFLKSCGRRYFYASLFFMVSLDRSRGRWHVERNRVSKFELEKKFELERLRKSPKLT